MRRNAALVVLGVVTAGLVAMPATAKDGDVRVAGTCSKASSSKLKLSEEDGRIGVEFEVDQNRNGVRWAVVLLRNASVVARRVRTTRPPSGSFEARVVASNRPGVDRFVARATRAGEVCRAHAAFRL
jgi:hypothetical protein